MTIRDAKVRHFFGLFTFRIKKISIIKQKFTKEP